MNKKNVKNILPAASRIKLEQLENFVRNNLPGKMTFIPKAHNYIRFEWASQSSLYIENGEDHIKVSATGEEFIEMSARFFGATNQIERGRQPVWIVEGHRWDY